VDDASSSRLSEVPEVLGNATDFLRLQCSMTASRRLSGRECMSALMDVENSLQPAKREWVNEVAGLLAAQQGYDFAKVSYAKRQDFQDQANEIVEVLSSKMYLDIQGLLLDRDKYIDLLLEERDFLLERSNW